MTSVNRIIVGNLGRDTYTDYYLGAIGRGTLFRKSTGRDHAPALSISDDMPEAGGGGESAAAPEVAALMAAEVAAEVEKQTGAPVIIEAAILQRVLEAHVRQHLDDLADLRVSLG